jgi:hypothetical protein
MSRLVVGPGRRDLCRSGGDDGTEVPNGSGSVDASIVPANSNVHIAYNVYDS